MSDAFSQGDIEKEYIAVVRGFTLANGTIDSHLNKIKDKMTDVFSATNVTSQEAITRYSRLKPLELPFANNRYNTSRFSLLRLRPATGRKHQLRRHLKHIFHPIIGDTTYGDGKQNSIFREQFDCHRMLLHARKLSFIHPHSSKKIQLKAGMDDKFKSIVKRFLE